MSTGRVLSYANLSPRIHVHPWLHAVSCWPGGRYLDDVHPGDGGLLVLPGSHKSAFERPHDLFGQFGEAHRRLWREDQYPATAKFGRHTGARWRDVFSFDGSLPEEDVEHGLRALAPAAGDVLIMPEALTHGVLPWRPLDRARHTLLMRFAAADGSSGSGRYPNDSAVPPEIYELLSAETQELTQFTSGGIKRIAARGRPLCAELEEAAPLRTGNGIVVPPEHAKL